MNINVTYRDSIDQSNALEARLELKLSRIDQKLHASTSYKAIFSKDGHEYNVQISFSFKRHEIVAEASAVDAYTAVDQAAERAERQVRKIHDRNSSH